MAKSSARVYPLRGKEIKSFCLPKSFKTARKEPCPAIGNLGQDRFQSLNGTFFRDNKLILSKSAFSVNTVPIVNAVERIEESIVINNRLRNSLWGFCYSKDN